MAATSARPRRGSLPPSLAAQATRVHDLAEPSDEELRTITEADVAASLEVAAADTPAPGLYI